MVREARGAYRDALAWLKLARPKRLHATSFAARSFGSSWLGGLVVLGAIGLVSPSSFGEPGALGFFASGWPSFLLLGVIALCLLYAVVKREDIGWLVTRLRDPWRRAMTEDPNYEGLVASLEQCPGALQSRFTMRFVWRPLVLAVLAVFFAFSSAYFAVDAILGRFLIGWEQPVLAAANALLSFVLWRLGAVGLSTWRLATSARNAISGGYF
ncbi:MAG: hypothetical protein ACRDKZ_04110 [Actinomycetota bacterium]